jgi:hypothetical protein
LALDEPAASTPITRPDLSSSGPPESPGTRRELVVTTFVSCAAATPSSCRTLTVRLSARILPLVTTSLPPPFALPTARVACPTLSFAESPIVAIARFDAFSSFSSATSWTMS